MPGARWLARSLSAAYRSTGRPEQQVALLRDTLTAASAAEAAARAEGRDPDAARLAREVCQVRAGLLATSRFRLRVYESMEGAGTQTPPGLRGMCQVRAWLLSATRFRV